MYCRNTCIDEVRIIIIIIIINNNKEKKQIKRAFDDRLAYYNHKYMYFSIKHVVSRPVAG